MNTKERISKIYSDLVIKKQTTKITVRDICETCQISRTTFYKYYKDPYEIIQYIFVNDCVNPQKI